MNSKTILFALCLGMAGTLAAQSIYPGQHAGKMKVESVAVIDELYRLAGIYNTCILCVLHFVPNGLKLRGHLGSELQRKAATILSIEKDEEPAQSVVKALKVRDGSPLDVPLMLFAWDKEAGMHVYEKLLRQVALDVFLD